jgi:hypothetical protein
MGFNFGVFAGTLAEYFDKENDRVTATTDKVLDSLANIVIRENDARQKKVDSAKESISRLEALGFTRAKAASIARGGLYAVNDAATAANTARDLGEDVNSYYTATAEFSPDDYKDYTVAELAQSITPQVNIDAAADALIKGRQINPKKVNEAVGKYKGSTTSTDIDLPAFAQDASKMGQGKFSITESSQAATFLNKIVQQAKEAAAESDSGLTVEGYDSSGNAIYAQSNPTKYAAWLKKTVPQLIQDRKDSMNARDFKILEAAGASYLLTATPSVAESASGDLAAQLGKAIPKEADTDDIKSILVNQLNSGMDYTVLKTEFMSNPGADADMFDQLYAEIVGQSPYHLKKYGPKPYTPPEEN